MGHEHRPVIRKEKNMGSFKRRLVALFSVLVIMAATMLVPGCKKDETTTPPAAPDTTETTSE
jgi:hypothetical protein